MSLKLYKIRNRKLMKCPKLSRELLKEKALEAICFLSCLGKIIQRSELCLPFSKEAKLEFCFLGERGGRTGKM